MLKTQICVTRPQCVKGELVVWRRRRRGGACCQCTFTVVILPVRKDRVQEENIKFVDRDMIHLMFVDPCIIAQFIKKNPTRCKNVSKFYYSIFIWSSTCFGRYAAHHQEPKTALAASGFSYVECSWTCIWWTLSGTLFLTTSTSYTSNNLPCMKNQRLPVQFQAPDDRWCVARNMLSFT